MKNRNKIKYHIDKILSEYFNFGFSKKIVSSIIVFCIISVFSQSLFAQNTVNLSYSAQRAMPSAVYISVYTTEKDQGKKRYIKTGYGSGTIVSRDGFILTNFHVVNKGDYYQVILWDGTECELDRFADGSFYVADDETDLAVLKIKGGIDGAAPIEIGDSDSLVVGEWVLAIGNPYGLRHSVTSGIISSVGRSDVGFAEIEDFIQTDVPINPGNSGGPLLNLNGELIGINTAIRSVSGGYQGISFAIPSKLAMKVYEELIQYGRVRRGWLGLIVREDRLKSDSDQKIVRVISVMKNSPASDAGLKLGDIVRAADGVAVVSKGKLFGMVKNKKIGSSLSLTVSRGGKLVDCIMVLREKESYRKVSSALLTVYKKYGIELSEDSTNGSLVVSRLSPSVMALYGGMLREGDMLVSINGAKLKGLDDFARLFAKWDQVINKAVVMRAGQLYVIDFGSGIE